MWAKNRILGVANNILWCYPPCLNIVFHILPYTVDLCGMHVASFPGHSQFDHVRLQTIVEKTFAD